LLEQPVPYVSITGLTLRSRRHFFRFWWHAIRAMTQAKRAPGIRSAAARIIGGVHHTVTVWDDEQAMRNYVRSGAHLDALRAFHEIATGKTIGFVADAAPLWNEVHDLWVTRGREV
jgi:hypothetical protein